MVTAVMLIKINPRIVFFGLLLGYFFGGNSFGKLGLASVGIPLYMGEIGWRPQETFETGLRKTVIWYLENLNWVDHITSNEYQH